MIRSKCEYFDLDENKDMYNQINERLKDDIDVTPLKDNDESEVKEIPLNQAVNPISLICKGQKMYDEKLSLGWQIWYKF